MGSYFVDRRPQANGEHLVHERGKCPPERFPRDTGAEYLGEFLDGEQALAVAGLQYRRVNGCHWCAREVHLLHLELPIGPAGAWRAAAA
jgi:hypothetical protein